MDRILEAAQITRNLVNKQIGEFRKFRDEMEELRELSEMHIHQLRREKRLLFDLFTTIEDTGLPIHWAENNSYEDVAQSFVRINRGGQPLDEFEVHLIEHRKSAFVRSIMAIAGSGKGNYWPNTQDLTPESRDLINKVPKFAQSIHQRLFEPEYITPPSDVNQPFMPVPPYFRKHLYLREVLPMLSNNEIIRGKNDFIRLVLRPEYTATPDMVVRGGYTILKTAEEKLKHISAISNREPLSLDIVPIFYWYNRRGQLVRSLCYGFLLWMMSGSDDDIRRRKLIFSGNRDRFEDVLHVLKPQIASIHFSGGAALNTAAKTAEFFQQLLLLLNAERSFEGDRLLDSARCLISTIAPIEPEETIAAVSHRRSARNTSIDTHSKINRLFAANMRCHICGGHIDLKRSHQMDHITPYATKQVTTPDGISPTHQFCNNNRSAIENYKQQNIPLSLPQLHTQRGQTPIQGMFDIEQDYWSDEEEFLPVDNENEN